MSPSESQLRAALHDGEGGEAPDANALISHALGVRRDRRRRINAIAGSVAAVACVGIGATVLVGLGGNGQNSGDSGGGKAAGAQGAGLQASATKQPYARGATPPTPAARRSASTAAVPRAQDAVTGSAAEQQCPAQADHFLLPGGGGSGQFGSTDPLFARPVAAMKVCAYPLQASAAVRTAVVSGSEATDETDALEAAPAEKEARSCPANVDVIGGTIEILAVDASGKPLKPVVITLDCAASEATNGTAVRYVATLPDGLVQLLSTVSTESTSNGFPGHVQTSPTR